jgi:peptidyl-prolyl cis-trans isomerase A (cyclophilin A)
VIGVISTDMATSVTYHWTHASGPSSQPMVTTVTPGVTTQVIDPLTLPDDATLTDILEITAPVPVTTVAQLTTRCRFTINSSLPNGTVGTAFSGTFTVNGGLGPYTWSPVTGLPPGLTATPSGDSLTISGTPSSAGTYPLTVMVTDGESPPRSAQTTMNLIINPLPGTMDEYQVGREAAEAMAGEPKSVTFETTVAVTGNNTGIVVPGEAIEQLAAGKRPAVLIDVNGYEYRSTGDITLELFPDRAPETVANFTELATGARRWIDPQTGQPSARPLYDGTIFHRVIPGFMIQGGDPLGNGTGGPGYNFADEFHPDLAFTRPYLLAMANAGPGTNGSQFFITVAPTAWLTGKHTIFGEVADDASRKVVDTIAAVRTGRNDRPSEDVVIESVTIER